MPLLPALLLVASADPDLLAVQEKMRAAIDAASPSVVAVVVSHNPKYGPPDTASPGRLGAYSGELAPPAFGRRGGFAPPVRDKLDLSDPRAAAENTFGSGVVLDVEFGLILVPYHLVADARKIYVRSSDGRDGSYADVHAADARSDLAVLRLLTLPVRGLRRATLADVRLTDESNERRATVFRGQWVLAVGHTSAAGFVDGQPSASWGILSNVRRRLPPPPGVGEEQRTQLLNQYSSLLQTDARLALGSSGGALVNLSGELIGLTTSTAAVTGSEAGGGYAVPMDALYRNVIDVLKDGREVEYGFLGIRPGDMTTPPERPGLRIGEATPNGPAAQAGLRTGDVIMAVNGRPVRDAEDLFLLAGGSLAGTPVVVQYSRANRPPTDTRVTLAKFANPHPTLASKRDDPVHGLRVDWSSLLVQQQMAGFGFGPRPVLPQDGVVVRELVPDSPAARAFKASGIPTGQVLIRRVNGTPVLTPAAFYAAAGRDRRVRLVVVKTTEPTAEQDIVLP